jgi:hypothetical protein
VTTRIIERIHQRLFRSGTWFDYAVCRILLYAFVLLRSFRLDTAQFMLLPRSLFTPYGISGFYPELPSYTFVLTLEILWQIALVLGILGLASRWVSWVIFVFGFFLMDLTFSYGTHWRIDVPIVFGLLVFALSSRAFGNHRQTWKLGQIYRDQPSREAHWPLEFFRWTVRIFMFCAGISKLQYSELSWISSNNLENQFKLASLLRSSFPLSEVSYVLRSVLMDLPLLCKVLAGAVLISELLSPFAVVSKKLDLVVHLNLFFMLLLAPLLLHVDSTSTLAIFVFFVPWSWFFNRWKAQDLGGSIEPGSRF